MWDYIKAKSGTILIVFVTVSFLLFAYSCEPKVPSLIDKTKKVTRQEFQLELDQLSGLADIRMVDFDKQERFRAIILQNALVLVQGQPFNPLGLITAIAGLYGIKQVTEKTVGVVKNVRAKRNNAKPVT